MASFMLARRSAREARHTLFYVQAVDQAKAIIPETNTARFYEDLLRIPSLQKTKRLPPVVLFHVGMRVRLTTTIQQPFAVQDVEGTVVGFDPDPADSIATARLRSQASSHAGDFACRLMPKAIYVKLDDCKLQLLPPAQCPEHSEHTPACSRCTSAAQPGVMAILPMSRTFKHDYSPTEKTKYVIISRTQIPLMPAQAVPLYSMQGTTADPGLVAYWFFPQRCTDTIRWLIVYVMLSRPRSLATLKSVNLTKQIRDIIEQAPPPAISSPTSTSCSTTRSRKRRSWHVRQQGHTVSCLILFERTSARTSTTTHAMSTWSNPLTELHSPCLFHVNRAAVSMKRTVAARPLHQVCKLPRLMRAWRNHGAA